MVTTQRTQPAEWTCVSTDIPATAANAAAQTYETSPRPWSGVGQTSEIAPAPAPAEILLLSPVAVGAYEQCHHCAYVDAFTSFWGCTATCRVCGGSGYVYRDDNSPTPILNIFSDGCGAGVKGVPMWRQLDLLNAPFHPKPDGYERMIKPPAIKAGDRVKLLHSGSGLQAGAVGEVVDITRQINGDVLTVQFRRKMLQIIPAYVTLVDDKAVA